MRHRKVGRQLRRTPEQKLALMRSLAQSLIEHGAIETTEAKAKELNVKFQKALSNNSGIDLFINATPANLSDLPKIGKTVFDIKVSQNFPNSPGFIPGLQMFLFQFQKQFELYTKIAIDDSSLQRLSRELFRYELKI